MTLLLALVEPALLVLVAILAPLAASYALDGALAAAALRGDSAVPDVAVINAAFSTAAWKFALGGLLLVVPRAITLFWRRGSHILTPFSLPAAYAALGLGFVLQTAYGNPASLTWPGPAFAEGVLYAGIVGAAILLLPGDVGAVLGRARVALLGVALALFALLAAFGKAPGSSGQTINLWGFQPIEIVKLCVALSVGAMLGARAWKLRWHRDQIGPLRFPRPRLLALALGTMLVAWLGLFAVKDFGPTLILAAVFLGLFYVATRSPGWVLAAVGLTVTLLAFFATNPDLAPSSTLALRVDMWRDVWTNGRPNGDQLAMSRWALAAGGLLGSGVGAGAPGALPAGHTDLIYAHLVEVLGFGGALLYLLLLAFCIADGLRVAAYNRSPERVMMATALGLLLAGQAAVILGGTLGFFPLTGVVVPFLSFGKTGTIALVAVVALLVRLGEDGLYAADTEELRELRAAVHRVRFGLFVAGWLLAGRTFQLAVIDRDDTTLRGSVTTLGDGTPVVRHDPRLTSLARRIRRGSILDRNGEVLAASPTPGARVNPLGDALGTVLGASDARLARAKWQVEGLLEGTLRGYHDLPEGPTAWMGNVRGSRQVVLAVPAGTEGVEAQRAHAFDRLAARGGEGEVARVRLTDPDLAPFLPIARMGLADRVEAIRILGDDVESRSARLTIDGKLQAAVAAATRQAAQRTKVGAAALVVMDASTGEVLARAQWPDFDPGGSAWRPLREADEAKFMGIYGPWSDKTGAHGVWQAGSVFKTLSALVAVREGIVAEIAPAGAGGATTQGEGSTCPSKAEPRFDCSDTDEGRPSFTLPGWSRPIHDHGDGGARGTLDLVEALARSSNVYFSQLALKLGPEPYRRLRTDGVEFGNPGLLAEKDGPYTGLGEAGSRRLAQTGFGQGAGSWNVMQAARLVGAIANGGTYLRCPASMELGVACATVPLLPPGASVEPILAGMKAVMERGTGARLADVPGVRVYGKTGTADAPGTRDEAPWGIKPGKTTSPHSWFVAIAEDATAEACGAAGRRFAVAAVVPHGGFGASAAGPLAIEAVKALQTQGYLPPAPPAAPSATKAKKGR